MMPRRRMRAWLAAAALFLAASLVPATSRADSFQLPGAASDANAWLKVLGKPNPAGATPAARARADAAVADATRKADPAALAASLQARVALGEATSDQFLALARALLRKTPPDAAHAVSAAWLAYEGHEDSPDAVPALLALADALGALGRTIPVLDALDAAITLAPDDAALAKRLADARQAAGMLVRRVTTEPDAEPPRACLAFTSAPRRAGLVPADWVRLDPPVPDAAVTQEGEQICVSGLPAGATSRITLRAGLPGEGGLALKRDATLAVAMANRKPFLLFDSALFLLPRGQAPRVTLASVNLSSVKLQLVRVSERNVVPFTRDSALGTELASYDADRLTNDVGRVVWEGNADLTGFASNKLARTALPIPDAMAEPGLYALIARPGDGTPPERAFAAQMILRTDLAPTVWRGADGLTVQVRAYTDVMPRAGVKLDLIARNNDILASTTTDADGVARFGVALLHGDGPVAPAALHAFAGDDFVSLDLTRAAFDLSDRGVGGAPAPGPIDPFIWTDRGIYRPGETVQVMALLRDDGGRPLDLPIHVRILRPNGQLFSESVPPRLAGGALHVPVMLSAAAPRGDWTVELRADPARPPLATKQFRVDAFVPDRMAVDLAPQGSLVAAQAYSLPITARYLFGAPAAGLTASGNLRFAVDPDPAPTLSGYRIGLADEEFAPDSHDFAVPPTDDQGHSTATIALKRMPDSTQPLLANVSVSVNDPSGRAVTATAAVKLRPSGPMIGIKPGFDGSVDADAEAGFDLAAVNADGQRIALPVTLRLVRERPDWRLVRKGQLARYETVWHDEPLTTEQVILPEGPAPLHITRRLPFGRYRLEAAQKDGLAATSVRFRAGWAASDSPDVPDKVDVSTDRRAYTPGAVARIHIAAPFAGQATLLLVGEQVHTLRNLALPEGGSDIDVPVDAAWGPGAYAELHVFRAGGPAERPRRAIGLVWLGLDPAARTLPLTFEVADNSVPRVEFPVVLHTAPGAWVSLAAVDEGVLRLTGFESPDPTRHYFGRRVLGIDIRDDWGRLIAPAEGDATALRQGGDTGGVALPEIPQKVVALFTPPVQAGPDGIVRIPLVLPDFAGQVRLMAVAWQGASLAGAATDVTVRDPLIAEPLLPRFLAPGDTARMAVQLQNISLPAGEAAAVVSLEGPLMLAGPERLAATLAPGASSVPGTLLRATGPGRGVIHLDVTGPGGFHVARDAAIIIRAARGAVSQMAGADLAPGADAALVPATDGFLPGSWRALASFGGAVRYDAAAMVAALDRYPLRCLEQAVSRGLPLAMLPDGQVAGDDRAGRLQTAIAEVLDHQRYDGGFSLWGANGDAEPWLSSYATEFLLRARARGAAIPAPPLEAALKFLSDAVEQSGIEPEDLAAQAYRLHVLALAGTPRAGAARILAERVGALPTPLAKAQLGAALARGNDKPRAEAAFAAALAGLGRKNWDADYGSALRDQLAVALLLRESRLLPERLARLRADLPGADLVPEGLSTQELAWAASAAGVLGEDARPARIRLGGADLPAAPLVSVALTSPATARNLDSQAVWQSVSITGVPKQAPAAARNQMRVSRRFLALDGSALDLDHLAQNTVFVLLIEGKAEDGQAHQASVMQGLPAGWEIAGVFGSGTVAGMSWLGELSETQAQPAGDDRYVAVLGLTGEKPGFRVAVKLRAVTQGDFELPGIELADMYRPGVFARQATNRITVLPP